jgi:hypothetical protein
MGRDYAYLAIERTNGQLQLVQTTCVGAEQGAKEQVTATQAISEMTVYLRVDVKAGGVCQFAYSTDGTRFQSIGNPFQAKEGKWIGAKVGLFCQRSAHVNDGGYANYDWFRIHGR